MVSVPRPARSFWLGFLPTLLANLFPLVGVLQFGWDAGTLVTVYALELLVTFPLAATKALFAQRPPRTDPNSGVLSVSSDLAQTRGSVRLVSWLPPVYPRTVPFVTRLVYGATAVLVIVALVVVQTASPGPVLTRPEVLLSVATLLAAQVGGLVGNYIGNGEYREASPYTVLETPMRQAILLVVLLLALPEGVDTLAVLVAFVVGKLLVEWSAYRAGRGDGGRLSGWLAGPDEATDPPEPPQVPDTDPEVGLSVDRAAVVWTAVFRTLVPTRAPIFLSASLIVWAVTLGAVGGENPSTWALVGVTLAAGVLFLCQFGAGVASVALERSTVEYRRCGDRLVAYDTWLDEPRWSADVDLVRDVEVLEDRLADRLLDTRTVAVTTGVGEDETERQLGPVTDSERLVEVFELPVTTTDLEPLNRPLAGLALSLVVGVSVAPPILASMSLVDTGVVFFAGIAAPFLLTVPWGVWRLAYRAAD